MWAGALPSLGTQPYLILRAARIQAMGVHQLRHQLRAQDQLVSGRRWAAAAPNLTSCRAMNAPTSNHTYVHTPVFTPVPSAQATGDKSELVDQCVDHRVYGLLPRCPECKGGTLKVRW